MIQMEQHSTIQLTCNPVFAEGDYQPPCSGFYSSGHTCDNIENKEQGKSSMVLFGGHGARYAGSPDGKVRTKDMLILHNSHLLGSSQTPEYNQHPAAVLSWERVTLQTIEARAAHVSFVKEGKLYIHGGYSETREVLSDLVEIDVSSYECKVMEYRRVTSNVERRWHCSFLLDNKFFIHGGWNDAGPLSDLLMLDMDTMKWSAVNMQGNIPSARRWHTLSPMPSGQRFLSYGGYGGPHTKFADLHMLDIETQRWLQPKVRGKPPPGVSRHTLTPVPGQPKQMLLMGGYTANAMLKQLYILHTDDMSWQPVNNAGHLYPVSRSGHKATPVSTQGIFVSGGFIDNYVAPFYWLCDPRTLS